MAMDTNEVMEQGGGGLVGSAASGNKLKWCGQGLLGASVSVLVLRSPVGDWMTEVDGAPRSALGGCNR